MQGVMMHDFNLSTQVAEARRFLSIQGSPGLHTSSRPSQHYNRDSKKISKIQDHFLFWPFLYKLVEVSFIVYWTFIFLTTNSSDCHCLVLMSESCPGRSCQCPPPASFFPVTVTLSDAYRSCFPGDVPLFILLSSPLLKTFPRFLLSFCGSTDQIWGSVQSRHVLRYWTLSPPQSP